MNKILIVDDSEVMRATLATLLYYINAQITVLQATNGHEAVSMAQTHQPDLILMDGNMPIMNGVEASLSLREQEKTRHIPLIGMTTNTGRAEIRNGLRQACATVLSKPFNMHDLQNVLERFAAPPVMATA